MPRLTADEKNLICLALDEYASGFSSTLSVEEHSKTRELAARLRRSILQSEDTH